MFIRHPFLNLNLGLVKENYVVVKKNEKKLWESRGFKKIRKYPIFHYKPNLSEVIMLGVPLSIEQFGSERIYGSKITDVCTCCGTYGMGGPGFFGLKLHGEYGSRWLIYCIWAAGEHVLFDGNILECHPNYAQKYNPIISYDEYSSSLGLLKERLNYLTVEEVTISKEAFEMKLIDSNSNAHFIQSYKCSDKFPEQAGTGQKRNSFETGEMKDYWLITYDDTYLVV